MRKAYIYYTVLSIILFNSYVAFGQSKAQAFEISKNLDIYATLFKALNNNYVDEIKPGELNTTAMDAMLKTLDPYTVYIPESRVEDAKFMTTGEYGGVGISVVKRDSSIIISMVMDQSPALDAGLLAGDEIVSIDGQLLSEKDDDEISMLLKGQPGTAIDVVIKRLGLAQSMTKQVVRRKINVDAIPYYGMLDSTIAYVSLSSFTKKAARKVAKAYQDLQQNHPKALIFDLRGNGGGLLNEAVDIMNLFIGKDVEVVRTKSRLRDKNYIYKTRRDGVDLEIPIVFLVDRNTASASEILSGAAQDLDRAVIMGERTFGKGLVQNVIPLSFNAQLKVTIAKYYIPSGRCIQAIDYSHKDEDGNPVEVNDSLLVAFKTKGGRTVYDGRGIKPDLITKKYEFGDLSNYLMKNFLIFDFSTQYRLTHDSIATPDKFEVDDELWTSFLDYLKDKEISYQTDLEIDLEDLKAEAKRENKLDELKPIFDQLQQAIDEDKKDELLTKADEIKRIIKTDIVSRYYFSKGVIIANLFQDKTIAKAMDLLHHPDEYQKLLKAEEN
jgi:carboxyl-terminal processing protease